MQWEELKMTLSTVQRFQRLQFRELGTVLGFVIICGVFGSMTSGFLTPQNIIQIILESSINAVVAIGMTLVIMLAGIDLSVGSVAALAALCAANLMNSGVPTFVAIIAGLCVGALSGLINGILCTTVGLQPFIVTLGTMSLFRGADLLYTNGQPITSLPTGYKSFFAGSLGPIPNPVIIVIIVVAVATVVVKYTKLGEYILAIGGNEEAARFSGIRVNLYKTITYMICGVLAALAGMVLSAQLGAAEPVAGTGWELTAIAASAIGGASLTGGSGSTTGTLIGALILGAMQNGLTMMNVQSYYQTAVTGVIIILAMVIDRYLKARNT
jgi:ribose transport system permease protein